MATNPVIPLDQSLAQLYCGACIANGVPDSMLVREMHVLRCQLSHQFSSVQEAMARGATMVPLTLNEQPPITSEKWAVWVNPKVRAMLEQKLRGRLWASLDSIFGCMADGNVVVVTGEDAAKLKKMGLSNGTQIVAHIESLGQLERERQQLMDKIAQYEQIFRAAGVGS